MNIDCFAFKSTKTCLALKEMKCANDGKCRFYKTAEKLKAEQEETYNRICKLKIETDTACLCKEVFEKGVKKKR